MNNNPMPTLRRPKRPRSPAQIAAWHRYYGRLLSQLEDAKKVARIKRLYAEGILPRKARIIQSSEKK